MTTAAAERERRNRTLSLRQTAAELQCGKTRVMRLVASRMLIAEEQVDPVSGSKRYRFAPEEIEAYRRRCRTDYDPNPKPRVKASDPRRVEHVW